MARLSTVTTHTHRITLVDLKKLLGLENEKITDISISKYAPVVVIETEDISAKEKTL